MGVEKHVANIYSEWAELAVSYIWYYNNGFSDLPVCVPKYEKREMTLGTVV